MDLRSHFPRRGLTLLILLLLPLMAGSAAFVVLNGKPQQFDAVVQVAVPDAVASSDSRIGLYVADFQQALTDDGLQQQIQKATGVPTTDTDSLTVSRVALSSNVEVDLTSTTDAKKTAAAALLAAKVTRVKLANQGLDVAQAAVTTAQQNLDKAQAALSDYQNSIGTLFPSELYQTTQSNIRTLQNSKVEASAAGQTSRVVAIDAQIKTLQAQVATLTPQVRQAQTLTNAVTAATNTLRSTTQTLTDKQTLAALAGNADAGTSSDTTPVSTLRPTGEGGAVAGVLALLFGLGILIIPDLLRRPENRRVARRARAAHAEPPAPDRAPAAGSAEQVAEQRVAEQRVVSGYAPVAD